MLFLFLDFRGIRSKTLLEMTKFKQQIKQKQQTVVKENIMAWLGRCLQEDIFSDCYLVTSEGLRVPAHKAGNSSSFNYWN